MKSECLVISPLTNALNFQNGKHNLILSLNLSVIATASHAKQEGGGRFGGLLLLSF